MVACDRYFFAVRLRTEGERGERVVLAGDEFDNPEVEETASDGPFCVLMSEPEIEAPCPPNVSANRLAPANAKALKASACAPNSRRAAPIDIAICRAG